MTFFCGTFALRVEITLQSRFVFGPIVMYFFLCYNDVIYFLDVVTFFYDVRITLFFGTFELRSEITLQ